jgi:hypothetical protein
MISQTVNSHPPKRKRLVLTIAVGTCILIALLSSGVYFLFDRAAQTKTAPESERVLAAQIELPFQVLIPAYLPPIFRRDKMEIKTLDRGTESQDAVQLYYPTRKGNQLVLTEWMEPESEELSTSPTARKCMCICPSTGQCSSAGMDFVIGNVHIKVELSVPNLLSYEQMQFVLDTLGPAANQRVFSEINDVPSSLSVPAATEIPTTTEGVQEVTLVVSPDGYSPAHFSVKKDIPVRLIFRQLGQVGCGNELYIELSGGKNQHLILETTSDKESIEFTPQETGEFLLHCPHYIYRGLMTVTDE